MDDDGASLVGLSLERLSACLESAEALWRRAGPWQALWGGGARPEPGRHYPVGDSFVQDGDLQFYLHAHDAPRFEGEVGHVHVFLRAKALRAGGRPLQAARQAARLSYVPPDANGYAHLIAVSLDANGQPIGLFTVNRWVTGESWLPARSLIAALDVIRTFDGDHNEAAQWLSLLIATWRPEIEALLKKRDKIITPLYESKLNDPSLEILSLMKVSLERRLRMVRRHHNRKVSI